jgi:patatin-like phospholipase/acyl hydrolase
MAKTRVLALDGGGIRGIVSVILLERLAADPALAGWLGQADVLAGTSTGGLIALGLARGLALAELRALYEQKGGKIFDDSLFDDILDLGKIAGADYSSKGLQKELKAAYGETTTLGALGKLVVVPTFDLDNQEELEAKVAAG